MPAGDPPELARHALERVCSGSDPSAAVGVYFHDHVNATEYRGHEGIRRSLGLYQLVFSDGDLRIHVDDQVTEGDRVASRWVAEGHNRGRPIRIWGIVISRIEDGEIVEDWAASDSLDLVRQLGPLRTLLLGIAFAQGRRRHVDQHPKDLRPPSGPPRSRSPRRSRSHRRRSRQPPLDRHPHQDPAGSTTHSLPKPPVISRSKPGSTYGPGRAETLCLQAYSCGIDAARSACRAYAGSLATPLA